MALVSINSAGARDGVFGRGAGGLIDGEGGHGWHSE